MFFGLIRNTVGRFSVCEATFIECTIPQYVKDANSLDQFN